MGHATTIRLGQQASLAIYEGEAALLHRMFRLDAGVERVWPLGPVVASMRRKRLVRRCTPADPDAPPVYVLTKLGRVVAQLLHERRRDRAARFAAAAERIARAMPEPERPPLPEEETSDDGHPRAAG